MIRKMLALLAVAIGLAAQAAEPVPFNITGVYTLPDGDSVFMAPLRAENEDGTIIRGGKNSRFIYRGPPTTIGVIQYVGINGGQIGGESGQGFDIIIDAQDVEAGIVIANWNGDNSQTGRVSTNNLVKNVRVMHGGYPTAAAKAFSINSTAAGGGGSNNDHHKFVNCYAQSFRKAGFHVKGNQPHDSVYDGCTAHDAGGRKPFGFWAEQCSFFRWKSGAMNSNSVDFQIGSPETIASIDGHNSENGRVFVSMNKRDATGAIVSVGSGGDFLFSAKDVRFDGKPEAAFPVVDMWGPGPFKFENCYFSGTNGVCPTMWFWHYFGPNWIPYTGTIDLSGVMLRQHGGTKPTTPIVITPFTWSNRSHGLYYQRVNEDGSRTRKPFDVNQPLAW